MSKPNHKDKAAPGVIAAAPEMLRVLQAIADYWADGDNVLYPQGWITDEDVEIKEIINRVLARAKGAI